MAPTDRERKQRDSEPGPAERQLMKNPNLYGVISALASMPRAGIDVLKSGANQLVADPLLRGNFDAYAPSAYLDAGVPYGSNGNAYGISDSAASSINSQGGFMPLSSGPPIQPYTNNSNSNAASTAINSQPNHAVNGTYGLMWPGRMTPDQLIKLGMPANDAAISMLGGQDVPLPAFGPGGQTGATISPYQAFQSPNTVGQFTGGNLAQYLAAPNAVNMQLPTITGGAGFGLSPAAISGALNTNLAYQKAVQDSRQQEFNNRLSQLQQAGIIDDRAAKQFSQEFVDRSRSYGNDASRFELQNAESPQTKRAEDANVQAKLAKYRSELSLNLEKAKTKITGNTKLSPLEKIQLDNATDTIKKWINSAEAADITEGDLNAILAGTSNVRTEAMGPAVAEAIKIYNAYGLNTMGVTSPTEAIDIRDLIRERNAAKQK